MAIDADARAQLGNVLAALPDKLTRYTPAGGYDFENTAPLAVNLFAVSEDDVSYLSIEDDLGNLIWKAVGGGAGGGGFGEDSPKGGPIFVTGAYSSAGAVAMEGDLVYGAVWTGVSTPEDEVSVKLLIERGDSQNYKPTGVYYYQTGQALESPSEDSPNYVSDSSLTLSPNDYSWETSVDIPTTDAHMFAGNTSYLFYNGERSFELGVKRSILPEVNSANFIVQDGSYGDGFNSASIYPQIRDRSGQSTLAAALVTPNGTSGLEGLEQTAVKNGDQVSIKIVSNKELSSVIFKADDGVIRSTEIIQAGFYNNVSTDVGGNSWETYVIANITDAAASETVGGTFHLKIKDVQGNLSESWHESDNTITTDDSDPSYGFADPVYNAAMEAIWVDADSFASYTITAVDNSITDYYMVEITDSSWLDFYMDPTGDILDSGDTIIQIKSSVDPSTPEQAISPFALSVLRASNGAQAIYTNIPPLLGQDSNDPTMTLGAIGVRSGPGGYEDTLSLNSANSLTSLTRTSSDDPLTGVTVGDTTGSIKSFALKLTSEDTAERSTSFDVVYDYVKYSGQTGSVTISTQVKGFIQRALTVNGSGSAGNARHSEGIPIGVEVVDPAKIKSKAGALGNLTVKVGTGAEGNFPYSAAITSVGIADASNAAEFGLNADDDHVFFDSHLLAQIQTSDSVVVTLEEVV